MLTDKELEQFNLFGFVVMRNVFSSEELNTIKAEFERRAAVASSYQRFDGTKAHNFSMMGEDTPFYASLLEDPRFLGPAEQMFGDVIGFNADANRYIKDTEWHYDAGGYEAYGVKLAMYLQPVRAYNGALRVIPGSHKKPLHDELRLLEPIGERWSREAASAEERRHAIEAIDGLPSYVCETDPGDVVAFDLRTFHAAYGGSRDRRMCTLVYYNDPRTPAEIELSIGQARNNIRKERDNTKDPWNPRGFPPYWTENLDGRPKRKLWLDRFKELASMKEEQNGVRVVAENGKLHIVPLDQA